MRICCCGLLMTAVIGLWNPIGKTNSVRNQTVQTEGKPAMYNEVEITFRNKAAEITLSGTLTLPDGDARHPVAILVHGQGPMDRDHSFAGMSQFKTIAHYLASRGIASLRYDKRGVGESGGDFARVTIDDLICDGRAACKWLSGLEEVDQDNIGLIGISEGGIVAPIVASESDQIAFCVMLAGPVLPGHENLALSFAILANGSHARDQSFTTYQKQFRRLLDIINEEMPAAGKRTEALELATELAPNFLNDNTRILLGGIEQLSPEELLAMLSSPCFTATTTHNPQDYLPRVECPLLALYAERDVHVPANEHMTEFKRILGQGRNQDYTVKSVAEVNHLFQECETGFPVEYTTIEHDISPEVLDIIGSWIAERIK